ncbi:hypothetical protein [Streptomyces pacificus]|uniref:Uncharacterized protein n=1 Tax=Streptomyces pacificus TaxID=2705029 RepID=A0A6A0ATW2_9ACTN|nr:hypothetical protein [Streptomyces pacificus]GFH35895.1 hypothetical protein SCWH03_21170 [Streptomyces pacificus]
MHGDTRAEQTIWGMHSVNGDSLINEERSALLTEIEETDWDPEENPEDGEGREQLREQ